MSSFNVTNEARRNLRREASSSSSSCASSSSRGACPAQQQQQQDTYEKAPAKAPAKCESSASSVVFKDPPKAPAKRARSSSSSAVVQQDAKAPAKGGKAGKGGACSPSLDPDTYHARLVKCIEVADEFRGHSATYKSMREMAACLIKAHGNEEDYDNILYPLDLRHRKHRTERACNGMQEQDQVQQGSWITVDRTPGGAVNLWAKSVYAETHGWKLKNNADRRAASDLIRATCTLIEQADVNMADHHMRMRLKYGKLHRHLRHIDKKLHTRRAARAAAKAPVKGDKAPAKGEAPAKKGWFSFLKRK